MLYPFLLQRSVYKGIVLLQAFERCYMQSNSLTFAHSKSGVAFGRYH